MARIKVQVPGGNFKSIQTGGGSTVVQQTIVQQRVAAPAPIGSTGGGTTISSANPTATIGLAAVDGTATTFMTSDSAPPLSQAIAPTWTGNHTFTPASGVAVTINAAASANQGLLVNGASSEWAVQVDGDGASGQSLGLQINAGTTSADAPFELNNYANDATFMVVYGDGHGFLGPGLSGNGLNWSASGAYSISAPNAAVGLVVNGASNHDTVEINSGSTTNEAYGLLITAGSSASDYAFLVRNQATTSTLFEIYGDGGVTLNAPTGGSEGLGTINVSSGYYVNGVKQTGGIGGGSSKTIITQSGGVSQSYSVPANANWLRLICIGGGGGGGGGAKNTSNSTAGGGGGGASGNISIVDVLASDVGSTLTITFSSSTGSAGGAGATVSGSGTNGTAGSTVKALVGTNVVCTAGGGNNGTAGTTSTGGSAGASVALGMNFNGAAGGGGGTTGAGGAANTLTALSSAFGAIEYGSTGGGGGGGSSGSGSGAAGGTGGSSSSTTAVTINGGASGTALGGLGGTGSSSTSIAGAGGGGGGGANTTTSGGKGGPGSTYGAGGGGGGGCGDATTGNGGTGGAGGVAACIILAW